MAARCNVVRPPPDWRSSQGSSRFLCSFQADSDSDASEIFRAYDGIPYAHPSSRGSSHGVVVGSGLFDSDTQHARARARGQQCANLVLTLARPVDNDLRPGESLARSGRSRAVAARSASFIVRSVLPFKFCLDPGRNPPVLTSARPVDDWRLGESLARLGLLDPGPTSDWANIVTRPRQSQRVHTHPWHRPRPPVDSMSVLHMVLPPRRPIRPRRLHTAIPHPQPSPARIRGPWWVFLVPPVPYPSPMMCAAIRLHHPFRKHALHSLATSTSLMSPVLDPFLARCATATAYPPRWI
ncbi:hypothetical protein B0H16DRAFT_1742940 [Mycena metata]|uniref:Uncharacterized protein n=1 Tax=Mycena metata TaxID=1033252 RepID=A0AAD7MEN0_9AGAR|nr:hypothetical protein B0H16DRAFT_1742940 [Mycena metata]